jgi:hypothetical protein
MRLSLAALVAVLASGCAAGIVVLRHPETRQIAECRHDSNSAGTPKEQIERCVKAYEQAGYKIAGDSR